MRPGCARRATQRGACHLRPVTVHLHHAAPPQWCDHPRPRGRRSPNVRIPKDTGIWHRRCSATVAHDPRSRPISDPKEGSMAELLPIGESFATDRRALTAHPACLQGRSDRRPRVDAEVWCGRRGVRYPTVLSTFQRRPASPSLPGHSERVSDSVKPFSRRSTAPRRRAGGIHAPQGIQSEQVGAGARGRSIHRGLLVHGFAAAPARAATGTRRPIVGLPARRVSHQR